jgi:hypothetical protein
LITGVTQAYCNSSSLINSSERLCFLLPSFVSSYFKMAAGI